MGFHTLEPEVAGGLGPRTVADTSVHPPVVSRLHYEFAGWLGDPLLESFPCYVITADVAELARGVGLTGFEIEAVEVSTTPEFEELHPAVELPLFVWLRVNGTAGTDDFAISDDHCLVVSDRALQLLRDARLEHCDVEPWTRA
ncbi:MAG: hypothetical protein AAF726_06140 [Planctomycetota bacterium]